MIRLNLRRILIALILTLGTSAVSLAQSLETQYYVAFFAYAPSIAGATPGHFMIAFGKEDAELRQSIDEGVFGFYPQSSEAIAQKIISPNTEFVPGIIKSDRQKLLERELIEARLSVWVSQAAYERAKAIKDEWESNTSYHLRNHNCVHFGHAIAKAIGLKLPKEVDATFPSTYLEQLVELN